MVSNGIASVDIYTIKRFQIGDGFFSLVYQPKINTFVYILYKANHCNIQDLKAMIRDESVVNAVNNILFLKKEETEEKIVITPVIIV